jgi:hypothetical protein
MNIVVLFFVLCIFQNVLCVAKKNKKILKINKKNQSLDLNNQELNEFDIASNKNTTLKDSFSQFAQSAQDTMSQGLTKVQSTALKMARSTGDFVQNDPMVTVVIGGVTYKVSKTFYDSIKNKSKEEQLSLIEEQLPSINTNNEDITTNTREQSLRILGLDSNTNLSGGDIREAFKIKVKQAHPDQGGNTEQFMQVNNAYNNLNSLLFLKNLNSDDKTTLAIEQYHSRENIQENKDQQEWNKQQKIQERQEEENRKKLTKELEKPENLKTETKKNITLTKENLERLDNNDTLSNSSSEKTLVQKYQTGKKQNENEPNSLDSEQNKTESNSSNRTTQEKNEKYKTIQKKASRDAAMGSIYHKISKDINQEEVDEIQNKIKIDFV